MESKRIDADDGLGNKFGCPNRVNENILKWDNVIYRVLGNFRPIRGD